MKTFLTSIIVLLFITIVNSQENDLETKSVVLDDFISFIANEFPSTVDATIKSTENSSISGYNITLLIETSKHNLEEEDKIILQQSLKLLAKRLKEGDKISIIVYSGQNGVLLENISVLDIKKSLFAITDIRKNIFEKCPDGITKAYALAKDNFDVTKQNMVVMLRNPNAKLTVITNRNSKIVEDGVDSPRPKNNNNVVLLTAITLLPELISIIKD